MKTFWLYTGARLLMFAVAFGLIWLIFGHWLEWDATTALYTAFIALAVSSIAALFVLAQLRDRFAENVNQRATRIKDAFEARKAAEDAMQARGEVLTRQGWVARPPAADESGEGTVGGGSSDAAGEAGRPADTGEARPDD